MGLAQARQPIRDHVECVAVRIDQVDRVAGRADGFLEPVQPFMRDVANDQRALHEDQSPVRMRSTNCFTVGTKPFE